MESIGKRLDLQGRRVDQGLTVYGNKGSTDQHAYVQQLREGVPNFFAVFIRVLESGGSAREVEPGVTAGDYLHGFLLGTRDALFEQRPRIDDHHHPAGRGPDGRRADRTVRARRRVSMPASSTSTPTISQASKRARKPPPSILALQGKVLAALSTTPQTPEQVAATTGVPESAETVYLLLEHLAANGRARAAVADDPGQTTFVRA